MEIGQSSRNGVFHGRMGRLAYFLLGVYSAVILSILLFAMDLSTNNTALHAIFTILAIIAYIVVVVFSIGGAMRRLHDLDQSGWLVLLELVPLVNLVIALILLFVPGTQGGNKHGEPGNGKLDPKSVLGL